ncbi:Embryonic polyadenylate-binding protein 2 [Senna tora]|uniref:Embryonic polyadenylate-binding protein 2 n=1 Tax=Senna tora TaxID=362788 RepID=A0A834WIZ3_9FABA|nr:Embryonic polyadenylate-binding protein 2 [Senna tora]
MGSVDRDDDRTFKANFTVEGVAELRERVEEKLKEFMGDYTDETLVEYVIVLLRNGRRKQQAKNELNVFLGDDSDSFVSWLWDHLALNIDLYVQPKELEDEAPKRTISEVQAGGNDSQPLNLESERGRLHKSSRSRRNKDWKELVRGEAEPPPLRSSEVDNTYLEEKTQPKVNHSTRSPPSSPPVRRKRGRPNEQQKTKKDVVSQVTINAPRRLLQFAVRDAVATSRPSNSSTPVERSLKRLRSVVSASSSNSSLVERTQRLQPVSRVSNPMATVIKAVAEAAEDVIKFKSTGSVFDRLGRGMNPSDGSSHLEDDYRSQEQNQSLYLQSTDYSGQYDANDTMLEHEADYSYDSTSDNEGFDDVNVMGHGVTGASQMGSSGGNRGDDSLMVQYSVANNVDDSIHRKQNRDHEQPAAPNTSREIVNIISVNVNTWKPPQYREPGDVAEVNDLKARDVETRAPRHHMIKNDVNTLKVSNGNANPAFNVKKGSQKTQLSTPGSSAAGRPLEDADSRTIYVSNVHFAATKDSLSRHFNKFGEVLKVIIVTDAATGQPKGSAYVEFMRKEAADNALSLDGTSFMSRILKVGNICKVLNELKILSLVVKKSSVPPEPVPTATMTWPRVVRGSPFPVARFSGVPFPRGIPGAFWPRPPIKIGARSMQWKRDAQGTTPDNSTFNTGSGTVPVSRGLTYVRTESKPESSLGTM